MLLATVMNYDTPAGVAMCKGWILLATRFNPKADIVIFHHDKIREVMEFGKKFQKVSFEKIDLGRIRPHTEFRGVAPASQDMTIGAWKRAEEIGLHHFIFAEADAWILSDLSDWWEISREKPYIPVREQRNYHGGDFFNSGTYSYHSRDGFITYGRMMEQYEHDGNRIAINFGDQGLLNAYCRRIGYDWAHPKIGEEFNAWARNCRVVRADDHEIDVRIGERATPVDADEDWIGVWTGWEKAGERARILHAFWRKKFWHLPECAPLWHYVLSRVS